MRNTPFLRVLLTFLLAFSTFPILPAFADDSDDGVTEGNAGHVGATTGEVLVVFDDQQSGNFSIMSVNGVSVLEESGIEIEEIVIEASEDFGTVALVETPEGVSEEDYIEELSSMPGVAYAQPNFIYTLPEEVEGYVSDDDGGSGYGIESLEPEAITEVNDTYRGYQSYLGDDHENLLHIESVWSEIQSNKTVSIAVLDTGCYVGHADLELNIDMRFVWDAYNKTTPGTITSSYVPTGDNHGHGTHVTGIAAAVTNNGLGVAGASYNANVIPIKVFNNTTLQQLNTDENAKLSASTTTLISAYDYLLGLVRSGQLNDLHVINMSLGGYSTGSVDKAFESVINTAKNVYDIASVCAGGNGHVIKGQPTVYTDISYPSDFEDSISVTSLTAPMMNSNTGKKEVKHSSFSDYNRFKDISIQGESIYSTYNVNSASSPYRYDKSGYGSMRGTSMAAPLVSGSIALLWAKYPTLTVDQVTEAIYSTARQINDTSHQPNGTHGSLDIGAAYVYVVQEYGDEPVASINDCEIEEIPTQVLTASGAMPEVVVKHNMVTLVKGRDYKVVYGDNMIPGIGWVTVKGIGSYGGHTTRSFEIVGRYSDIVVSGINSTYSYTGSPIKPAITSIKLFGKEIYYGQASDWQVDYVNATNRGMASAIIKHKGSTYRFTGDSKTISYRILASDIESATISGVSASYLFMGVAIKPNVTVKLNGRTLSPSVDYEISYKRNTVVGIAEVVITGIGNYQGTVTQSYRLTNGWYTDGAGARFYFENGLAVKGSKNISGKWYRFSPSNGSMVTGSVNIDGDWYYYHKTQGYMLMGSQNIDGKWYRYDPWTGKMLFGSQYIDGKWYWYDLWGGYMLFGSQYIDEKWYWYDLWGGYMLTGSQFINGSWYWYDLWSGYMLTGWLNIYGTMYYYDVYTGIRQ